MREKPVAVIESYNLFLYSTPFLVFSMLFSLVYVHLYRTHLINACSCCSGIYEMGSIVL